MKIVFIDGMGGGMAAQLISHLPKKIFDQAEVIGLGTNSLATAAMLKAGVKRGATGENAICFSVGDADLIVGPIGIIIPNTMMGEISPKIAEAVASARCKKILLPVNQNHVEIIGLANSSMALLIKEATERITQLYEEHSM
ncbi:MAG: DUF3842 family protein [Acidaminococcaceae bacterium]